MVRVLNSNVGVEGRWYLKGQSVDEVGDAASRIGDHAWEEVESGAAPAPPSVAVPEAGDASGAAPASSEGEGGREVVDPTPAEAVEERKAVEAGEAPLKEPARHGPGSSEKAWRAYAEQAGVDVSGVEDRAAVIAAVEKAQRVE